MATAGARPTPPSYDAALVQYEGGNYDAARRVVEESLRAIKCPGDFADALVLLACSNAGLGAFAEAERLLATCAGYVDEHLGPTHPSAAIVLLNRGIVILEWYRLGERAEPGAGSVPTLDDVRRAHRYLAEAKDVLLDVMDVQRLVLADVYHNLGVCCELVGNYTTALDHYMRSLQIRTKFKDSTGVTELKLALTMEHIAMIYRLTESRLAEAGRLMASVATTRRHHLGPLHPLYASTLLAHGVLAQEAGDRKLATALLLRCLRIRVQVFGENHTETRTVVALLGGPELPHVRRTLQQTRATAIV